MPWPQTGSIVMKKVPYDVIQKSEDSNHKKYIDWFVLYSFGNPKCVDRQDIIKKSLITGQRQRLSVITNLGILALSKNKGASLKGIIF